MAVFRILSLAHLPFRHSRNPTNADSCGRSKFRVPRASRGYPSSLELPRTLPSCPVSFKRRNGSLNRRALFQAISYIATVLIEGRNRNLLPFTVAEIETFSSN